MSDTQHDLRAPRLSRVLLVGATALVCLVSSTSGDAAAGMSAAEWKEWLQTEVGVTPACRVCRELARVRHCSTTDVAFCRHPFHQIRPGVNPAPKTRVHDISRIRPDRHVQLEEWNARASLATADVQVAADRVKKPTDKEGSLHSIFTEVCC